MAKKTYLVVRCGILDKRHIFRINNAIWLFLHMLNIVNWDDGIIYEWKDRDAADELGFSISTIRNQRRQLDELNYITCVQKPHGLHIKINNWTNPREYSGKVYNKKYQGVKELTPSIKEGINEGDSQGDNGLTSFIYQSTNIKTNSDPLLKELNQKWNVVKGQIFANIQSTNRFKKLADTADIIGLDDGFLRVAVDGDPEIMNQRIAKYSKDVMKSIFRDDTELLFVCKEEIK